MKIVVNADDFGRDMATTDAIVDCFVQHKITSTTLMVVHKDCFRAAKIAHDEGFAVGLHLCLDEGRPVSNPLEIPHMLNEQGELDVTLKKLYSGKIKVDELCLEITNQINKFSDLGLGLTHIDSHHHIHCHPLVLWALRKVSKSLPFPLKIRSIRNFECGGRLKEYGWVKFIYKELVHLTQKRFFMTTDYFTSLVSYSDKTIVRLENNIDSIFKGNATVEIMCHPGNYEEYSYLMKMENLHSIALRLKIDFIDYSML